jgi:hypothetical protein
MEVTIARRLLVQQQRQGVALRTRLYSHMHIPVLAYIYHAWSWLFSYLHPTTTKSKKTEDSLLYPRPYLHTANPHSAIVITTVTVQSEQTTCPSDLRERERGTSRTFRSPCYLAFTM